MSVKRDWFQIIIDAVVAVGCGLLAYQTFMHPREALTIVLTIVLPVAGAMAFIGFLGLVGILIGKIINRLFPKTWRRDRADRMQLWLLSKGWLAEWFPHRWDQLKEGFRRNHCCELSDCWDDPEHTYDGHKVCSRHYAEILEIEARRLPNRYRR